MCLSALIIYYANMLVVENVDRIIRIWNVFVVSIAFYEDRQR